MSKRHGVDPIVRFADAAPSDRMGQELSELFRAVPDETPMSAEELVSVRRRLARTRTRRPRRSRFSELAILLSVLAGGASAALAEWSHPAWWRPWSKVEAPARVMEETQAPVTAKRGPAPARLEATTESEEMTGQGREVAPSPSASSPRNGEPKGLLVPAREPAFEARSPDVLQLQQRPLAQRSGLALESESLERALVALRREHDPRATLALLDDHDARFPHGELALEASGARVEALIMLGRRNDALRWLERMQLERAASRIDLLLLRAELFAENDCGRALADFDRVLERQLSAPLEERALYGRAACRLRSGDKPGAIADLGKYLSRYPNGRFAQPVRAHLK